jgi:hypothetical protein
MNSVSAVKKLWQAAISIDPDLNKWIFMSIKPSKY